MRREAATRDRAVARELPGPDANGNWTVSNLARILHRNHRTITTQIHLGKINATLVRRNNVERYEISDDEAQRLLRTRQT